MSKFSCGGCCSCDDAIRAQSWSPAESAAAGAASAAAGAAAAVAAAGATGASAAAAGAAAVGSRWRRDRRSCKPRESTAHGVHGSVRNEVRPNSPEIYEPRVACHVLRAWFKKQRGALRHLVFLEGAYSCLTFPLQLSCSDFGGACGNAGSNSSPD